jgi:hypothetical protein
MMEAYAHHSTEENFRGTPSWHAKLVNQYIREHKGELPQNFMAMNGQDEYMYVDDIVGWYHNAATTMVWAHWIDAPQYNGSGCLQRGAPYIPRETLICRYRRYKPRPYRDPWPDGYDGWRPGCTEYLWPLTYFKMAYYAITNPWLPWVLDFAWMPYSFKIILLWDPDGVIPLPPNLYPCLGASGVPLAVLAITMCCMYCCCLGQCCCIKGQEAFYGDRDELVDKIIEPKILDYKPTAPIDTSSIVGGGVTPNLDDTTKLRVKVEKVE